MQRKLDRQSGMVSIITVLFFMILVSVIVTGFVRIMSYEQRQATDNDLSARALAAAESGIEDGKRIIMFCRDTASLTVQQQQACTRMLSANGDCSVATSSSGSTDTSDLRTALKLQLDSTNKYIVVGDPSADYQQYYSCLTIDNKTQQVKKTVTKSRSAIIPFNMDSSGGNFSQVTLSWKNTPSDLSTYGADNNMAVPLTQYSAWKTSPGLQQKPPVLRVEIIPYTSPLNLDTIEHNTRTFFIEPTLTTGAVINLASDNRGAAGQLRVGAAPVARANCTVGVGYSCSATIQGFTTPANKYYMRTTLLYGDASDVTVQAYDNGGNVVAFEGAQSVIDVTGRANDVFRRVRAYVSFGTPTITTPEYAVESAADICKNMVTSNATVSLDNCTPAPPPPPPPTDTFGGCTVTGGNFVYNGGFDQNAPELAGPGLNVSPNVNVAAGAGFTSDLPNRGTNVYPDDAGLNGTSNGWTGGFSIQTGISDYKFLGSTFAHAEPFPGDPARGIPAAANYWYSNPNQSVSMAKGTDALGAPFAGELWRQDVYGLTAGQTYVFATYFNNMLIPPESNYTSIPSYRNPLIHLVVNGTAVSAPYEVKIEPDAWVPVSVLFTAPVGTTPTTPVKLAIYDGAATIDGDDFAMTGVSFYKCQ